MATIKNLEFHKINIYPNLC